MSAEPEHVWITRLDADGEWRLAVKDNIDVAGVPTTAACPAFSYVPKASAPVVTRLEAAGATVIGKANMDQFATGLTGARSPYGVVRSALDPSLIGGGSSSGSAVAVAAGLADVALGTDTAGSGRVPAACNGIVGLKPSVGLLPIDGIVPACRSIDCPSIFTRTVAEARRVLEVLAPEVPRPSLASVIAGPDERSLSWCAPAAVDAFRRSLAGIDVVEIDLDPFFAVGDLLYGGSWVAERYAAVGGFMEAHADECHPVVASIILGGRRFSAADAWRDRYRLDELRSSLPPFDVLVVPTVPDVPTVDAVLADPVGTNTALGRYTTFVNLLGLCAVSTPGAPRADGVPSGVTVIAPNGHDHVALEVAATIEGDGRVPLCVVGAHLEGQPLHHQLTERRARLVARTTTSADYRLHALHTVPPKPGLARTNSGGAPIEVEVWSLMPEDFGTFVAAIPPPLAIGKVELADGTWVPGFVCEPAALAGAPDITPFGGWRGYVAR